MNGVFQQNQSKADPLKRSSHWFDCDHNWNYNLFVNQVVFSPAAVRQFKRLPAAARRLLKEVIRERLAEQDPTEETRNRFRLRRISEGAGRDGNG